VQIRFAETIEGRRHLSSTKRPPVKKLSVQYSFQNVQASFSYLFQQVAKEAATPPIQKQHQQQETANDPSGSAVAANTKEAQRTSRQISYRYLFDHSQRAHLPMSRQSGSRRHVESVSANQQQQRPVVATKKTADTTNQIATLSYLFTAKSSASTAVGGPQHKRGRKKESSTAVNETIGGDDVKHKNHIISLKYLFGSEYVMLILTAM
jgi:hypothetical protein